MKKTANTMKIEMPRLVDFIQAVPMGTCGRAASDQLPSLDVYSV
jgi:hypothetical protein